MFDEVDCVICREIEFYNYRELRLVKCKYCEDYFHRICYGILNFKQEDDCIITICDPCQYEIKLRGVCSLSHGRRDEDYKCIICLNGGLLKRVLLPKESSLQGYKEYCRQWSRNSIWIHVECAIYSSKYVSINNWRELSCIEITSPIPYVNDVFCCYCERYTGVLQKCSTSEYCNRYFHIHCLMRGKFYHRRSLIVRMGMTLEAYCHEHEEESSVSEYETRLT